jgi:hypothetical protein
LVALQSVLRSQNPPLPSAAGACEGDTRAHASDHHGPSRTRKARAVQRWTGTGGGREGRVVREQLRGRCRSLTGCHGDVCSVLSAHKKLSGSPHALANWSDEDRPRARLSGTWLRNPSPRCRGRMAFGLIQIEGVIAEDPRFLLPYVVGNRRAVGSRARAVGFPYCRGNSVLPCEAHGQKSEAVAGHREQSVGLTVLRVDVGGLRKIADTFGD